MILLVRSKQNTIDVDYVFRSNLNSTLNECQHPIVNTNIASINRRREG